MRYLAQARNPYSPSWLWIPGSRFARPGMTAQKLHLHHFKSDSVLNDNRPLRLHDLEHAWEFIHQRHQLAEPHRIAANLDFAAGDGFGERRLLRDDFIEHSASQSEAGIRRSCLRIRDISQRAV